MKQIIIIDPIKSCSECHCAYNDLYTEDLICSLLDEEIKEPFNGKLCKCPIKTMPSRMRGLTNFESGWNACIDKITSEKYEEKNEPINGVRKEERKMFYEE